MSDYERAEIERLRAALAEANTENVEYRAENADLKAALAEAQRERDQFKQETLMREQMKDLAANEQAALNAMGKVIEERDEAQRERDQFKQDAERYASNLRGKAALAEANARHEAAHRNWMHSEKLGAAHMDRIDALEAALTEAQQERDAAIRQVLRDQEVWVKAGAALAEAQRERDQFKQETLMRERDKAERERDEAEAEK